MPPTRQCLKCGEKIQPSVGECLFCPPEDEAGAPAAATSPTAPPPPRTPPPAPVPLADAQPKPLPPALDPTLPPAAAAGPVPPAAPIDDRAYGLLLFDAEEALARGQSDRALVHASRAMKERPADLIARGLFERARRDSLRGRRREKLDSRVGEAKGLFEQGQTEAAEKIVNSALKLVPDHAEALALFAVLRDRRLAAPTTEAEAERELERFARAQARRDAEAARAALRAGWDFRAALMVRRALRHVPDDRELLELLTQAQGSLEATQVERQKKRTLAGQVKRAKSLLDEGMLEQSRNLLQAVLKAEPGNEAAQSAMQGVRLAWLQRQGLPAEISEPGAPGSDSALRATPPSPPGAVHPLTSAVAPESPAAALAAAPPVAARLSLLSAPTAPMPQSAPPPPSRPATGAMPVIPPEILLPRARRTHTPWGVIAGGATLLLGALVLFTRTGGDASRPSAAASVAPSSAPSAAEATPPPEPPGPLTDAPPALREAVESTLAAYTRALESMNADALRACRPDLTADERALRLRAYEGAINVAVDLRVLDVIVRGDAAEVPLLRRDIIVGGRGEGVAVEETLRFVRRAEAWMLHSSP